MPQPERKSKEEVGLYLPPEVLRLRPPAGQKPYTMETRAVLAEVLQLSRKDGQCSASDAHFVKRLGVSKNTASRAVQRLITDGHLLVGYDTTSRLTRFLTPATDHPQNGAGHQPQNGGGADSDHPHFGADTTPKMGLGPPPKWGTNKEGKVEEEVTHTMRAASRRVGGTESLKREDENPTSRRRQERGARAASTTAGSATAAGDGGSSPEHFARFWAVWPNQQRRKDAAAVFAALSADDQQHAAERATSWLQQHSRQVDRGATPHPATWLRGEQWNDGPEPAQKQGAGPVATTAKTDAGKTISRQKKGDWK